MRQNPVHQVLQFRLVFGVDHLVFLFSAVFQLYLGLLEQVAHDLLFRIRLALELLGDLLVGGAFLGLVNRMALETVVSLCRGLGGVLVEGMCIERKRKRKGGG